MLPLSLVWINFLPGFSAHNFFPSTHPLQCCQNDVYKMQLCLGQCPPQKTLLCLPCLQNKIFYFFGVVYKTFQSPTPAYIFYLKTLALTIHATSQAQLTINWICHAFSSLSIMFILFLQPRRLPFFLLFIYQNPTLKTQVKLDLSIKPP